MEPAWSSAGSLIRKGTLACVASPCAAAPDVGPTIDRGGTIHPSPYRRLAPPPATLIDDATLFLDFDGTLAELTDRPQDVSADAALRDLLLALQRRLKGRLAIVSGRSLDQLDVILGPVAAKLVLSGSHGHEHRSDAVTDQPQRPQSLDLAAERLKSSARARPALIVEEKSFGVALHYRQCPEFEAEARALAQQIAAEFGLHVQDGKMMVELRLPGGGKDVAVRRMMAREPMLGTRPIFIGDDLTDEPAFAAASSMGGAGILVGPERQTAAVFRLADPAAVRQWLREAAI